jgi:hypothetical protein
MLRINVEAYIAAENAILPKVKAVDPEHCT